MGFIEAFENYSFVYSTRTAVEGCAKGTKVSAYL